MSKRLNQVLVVDVEATCWEGTAPEGQESEIIEIGYCILDAGTGERARSGSILVRPARSTVSAFCTGLTTLTQEIVDAGVPFADACQCLRQELGAKQITWASYGDYDRKQFERQCQAWGVAYPFGDTHVNVKNLFALMHCLSREVGMANALGRLGLPLEGTHHRGGDDARNIASILAWLLRGPGGVQL